MKQTRNGLPGHSFTVCLLLACSVLLPSVPAKAQRQDTRLLLYNIGFGGIGAGIGAVCNKPKGAPWKKAFLKGFWQGAIGGALHYSGKKCVYLINKKQDIGYGLPAMLLHSAGNSIVENAAYGRPFLQSWNLYYGPLRIDYTFKDKGAFKVRFLPYFLYSVAVSAKGAPDWKASLLTGCVTFKTDKRVYFDKVGDVAGLNQGRATIYSTAYINDPMEVQAHELVHYFQFNEYQVCNSWLAPLTRGKGFTGLKTVFSRYIYFDAPYMYIPYGLEGYHKEPHYFRNFFELESERFATNRDVPL